MNTTITHSGRCSRCGDTFTASGCGTGYGITPSGARICYRCCADDDRAQMQQTGRIVLYLSEETRPDVYARAYLTNWPGSLRFKATRIRRGNHNIAGSRTDVWFIGPDGYLWWGVQYGNNTQLTHCRRTREQVVRAA